MAVAVIMPRTGQSVESCILTAWHKKVGDEVKVGDPLFSYETDKSSFEEEAKVEGVLLATFFEEYDDVPCLQEVCVIGKEGEDISSFGKGGATPEEPKAEETKPEEPKVEEKKEEVASAPKPETTGKVVGASPRARHAAETYHVNLDTVEPTGPNGRIIERDVLNAQKSTAYAAGLDQANVASGTGLGGRVRSSDVANAPVATASVSAPVAQDVEYQEEKLSHVRKVIGNAMRKSLSEIPQLTHMMSFDASALMDYRAYLKEAPESMGLPKITVNDLLLFAVSRVLLHYPTLNANIDGDIMRTYNHVHLGIAVDTPRGLLVPTLFNADQKSLVEIAKESKELAAMAKEGSINPDLLKGGSFTVTNVGSMGVEYFTPIINPPQTGILGVGAINKRVKEDEDDFVVYPAMGLSLSFDHQAIDGALAAKFLSELREALENYPSLLAK